MFRLDLIKDSILLFFFRLNMESDEEDKIFPELLAEAGFQNTAKRVWQFNHNGNTVAFLGRGNSPIDYVPRVTGFIDGDIADIWLDLCSIEKFLAWITVNNPKEETPGFTQEIEVNETKQTIETKIVPTRDRQLTILTWGTAIMNHKPSASQRNFFVGVITTRKRGVNLKKHNGKSEEIQVGIMADPKFPALINNIVNEVEEHDLKVISISCTKGRHRSVAMAEIVKKYIYPNAQIQHLTL